MKGILNKSTSGTKVLKAPLLAGVDPITPSFTISIASSSLAIWLAGNISNFALPFVSFSSIEDNFSKPA